MTTMELPALAGRTPLAFLAALGLLHLATHHGSDEAEPPRLSWHPDSGTAQLHTEAWADLDELAAWLMDLAADKGLNQLLPSYPPDFPPGGSPDPLVGPPENHRKLIAQNPAAETALSALVTDLATNKAGRVRRTHMVAPSGAQSFRSMLKNQADAVRGRPEYLREALLRWRRVSSVPSEYFDHAARIGAADAPDGEPGDRSVPGATWLAIAGLPAYRLASDQQDRAVTTGWHYLHKRPLFIWPLWTSALDEPAVQTLLEHPVLTRRARDSGDSVHIPLGPDHRALGITRMYAAHRRNTGHSDGPLTPLPVTS